MKEKLFTGTKLNNIVFWGAGKIGKQALEIWEFAGISPRFFIDNSTEIQRKSFHGVDIISYEQFKDSEFHGTIYITIAQYDDVLSLLQDDNLDRIDVKIMNSMSLIVKEILTLSGRTGERIVEPKAECNDNVLFDFSNGLALGGVETWSNYMMTKLKNNSISTKALINCKGRNDIVPEATESIVFGGDRNPVLELLNKLRSQIPCTIVCNFAGSVFATAILAKKWYSESVKIIAVQHNDEEAYYKNYSLFENEIDVYMYISNKMKHTMDEYGCNFKKRYYLPWSIPCNSFNRRIRQGCLRLGYAGRVTILQKRCDLLYELAEELKKRDVEFVMTIVGVGDYYETLREKILNNGLQNDVILKGYLVHDKIRSFWATQDIMISLSDWEGHSISQCEAMAEGAVPIISDVSGARDDVEDGVSGFIISKQSIKQAADRIVYLDENRDVLFNMSKKAHQFISDNCCEEMVDQLWRKIL